MTGKTVGIVGCGASKRDTKTEARNLYTSNYFSLKREYVENFCDHWVILSAKYGLLHPTELIESYETTIGSEDFSRHSFIEELADDLEKLSQNIGSIKQYIVLAGENYANIFKEAAQRQRSRSSGNQESTFRDIKIEYPFQERQFEGIGDQMRHLRKAVDKDTRNPDGAYKKQTNLLQFR